MLALSGPTVVVVVVVAVVAIGLVGVGVGVVADLGVAVLRTPA